ncbi:ABC-2 type transport system permease protein [Tumebacillus sp. BK434]|uniref:ABC transporter permease n=1 Tax=Tumebacillus sp. BK434 TaxID=2512169 RepID=UPI001049D443|nr:ABC transporter permease [Tumebacillus sp. BK434]TCP56022.1 ABC-2 type transport system permease protein [Tumebacillus sp. BK434]
MFNLIRNENMKIYGRPRTWAMFAVLILAIIVQLVITDRFLAKPPEGVDWKQEITQQTDGMRQALHDTNNMMPEASRKQLEAQIKMNEYAIEHNIAPYEYTAWKFAESASGMIFLVTLFTVIVAGDIVATEFTWGTIKLLLIRPVSRTKILYSKYISTLLYALLMAVVLLVISFVLGGLVFGFSGVDQPFIYVDGDGVLHQMNMASKVLLSFGLEAVTLLMIVTIAFMISAAFRSSSLSISLSIFVMFAGSIVVQILSRYEWIKYILFANLDLSMYFMGMPLVEGMTLGFSVLMLAIYFVIMHVLAWTLFTKRDVAA